MPGVVPEVSRNARRGLSSLRQGCDAGAAGHRVVGDLRANLACPGVAPCVARNLAVGVCGLPVKQQGTAAQRVRLIHGRVRVSGYAATSTYSTVLVGGGTGVPSSRMPSR